MVSTSTDWSRATRAESLDSPKTLKTRIVHDPSVEGLIVPSPRFFSGAPGSVGAPLNGNGTSNGAPAPGTYDAQQIRSFGGGVSVVQASMALSARDRTERPYEENVWVRSALKALSSGFNRLPFAMWTMDPREEGAEIIDDHPLTKLLRNPSRMMTQREFFRAHVVNFKHDGEVYWFLMNDEGNPVNVNEKTGAILEIPTQILPVRGELVEHKLDDQGMPVQYRYGTGVGVDDKSPAFPWASVVPFLDFDPYNMVRGLGDVRGVMREVDLYFQAFRYLDASVKNGGDPGGFIIFEDRLSPEELDARQAVVDDTFDHTQARRHRVMDRGATYVPNKTTPKDMEYVSMFEWMRSSILAGLGVPPPIVGDYDNAHFNNILEARREMWEGSNGILSLVELTTDVILNRLVGRMEMGMGRQLHGHPHFDTSGVEVLQRDTSSQITAASEVSAKGIGISFNEAMSMQNVDVELPDSGDEAWVAQNFRKLGEPSSALVGQSAPASQSLERSKNTAREDTRTTPSTEESEPGVTRAASPIKPNKPLARAISKWLGAYHRAQVAKLRKVSKGERALTKASAKRIQLNEKEWASKLEALTKGPIKTMWSDALKAARSRVGGPFIGVTDPRIIDEIASQVLKLSEGASSVVADRVRSALIRGLTGAGDVPLSEAVRKSLPAITEELKAVFGSNDARASTIARTEQGRAQNGASFKQMDEAGVATIRWVTSGDGLVRESHVAAGNQGAIKYGSTFGNGLRFPHDPRGPAGEVANCRCTFEVVDFEED